MPSQSLHVCCLGEERTCRAGGQTSEFDPTTLALTNGNAFDADFCLYPSACLNRYDIVS
jgi:hypothetical protein